jgi:hypothetical protein
VLALAPSLQRSCMCGAGAGACPSAPLLPLYDAPVFEVLSAKKPRRRICCSPYGVRYLRIRISLVPSVLLSYMNLIYARHTAANGHALPRCTADHHWNAVIARVHTEIGICRYGNLTRLVAVEATTSNGVSYRGMGRPSEKILHLILLT